MTEGYGSYFRNAFATSGAALLRIMLVVVAGLSPVTPLIAQVENGVTGTVTDATGAMISGAALTVINTATGVIEHATTSSAGTFRVVGLEPGHYSVAVEAAGFKRSVETDVIVEVAKMSTVDFRMAPGATTVSIQVMANAVSLNTTAPQIGTTLEPELVRTAPIEINGLARQLDSFMYLAPGVQGNAGSHNINGGLTFENEVQFNGVPVAFVQFEGVQTNINPPYEMVNEFRVNSSTFDATYGLGQGAVTYNMASGTNLLHGDAFDILRNQLFDSDGFFPTYFRADGHPAPPVDQQNDYGFTISGPVTVPKLYNGKDRTFFLFSSDWFRQNQAQKAIGTVPTAAMKNGDFSGFVDSNGNQIPIYDPTTGKPFPGNIIPQSRFSAAAKAILPLIPDPDRPGVAFGLQDNKSPAVPSLGIRQHLWGYTIDHHPSPTQTIHFSQWRDALTSPYFTAPPIVPTTSDLQSEITDSEVGSGFVLSYLKTMTNNLVMTAGADWIGEISRQFDDKTGVSFPAVAGGSTFPLVYFDGQNNPTQFGASGSGNLGGMGAGFQQNNNRQLGVVIVNNWLWNRGRHNLNFGGQFRRTYEDLLSCSFCSGAFSFSQRTTSVPNSSNPDFGVDGSSFASFLLGLADGGNRLSANTTRLRNKEFGFYAQDDIKMTPRLTADVGLRWDILVPFTEDHNYVVYVDFQDPTVPDPGAGNLPGGASKFGNCTGCAGVTRAAIDWKAFQPRLGLSYSLNSKTVIQSGFFLTYLDGGAYEYGSEQTAFYFASLLGGEFLRQPNASSNPAYGSWDANPMPVPPPTPFSPSIGNGNVILAFNPKTSGRPPYDQAWNLGLQRQLPWNMFVTVAYVGNRAIHIPSSLHQPEQPNPSVLKYGSLLGELADSPDAVAAGITLPYPDWEQTFGGTGTVLQALLPFPQYSDIYNTYETEGTSFYNGLQTQAEKRYSNGLSYLADFTFSRTMADEAVGATLFQPNPINSFNMKPEFTPSFRDQKYLVNVVATYTLPAGPGQKYFDSKGILGQVLGGWQVSGIMSYAGGYPFGAYNGYNPLYANFGDRPNVVPGVAIKTFNYKLSKEYFTGKTATQPVQFTTDAFANTGPWALGNAVATYSSLRTPPLRIENFDAIKKFSITERVQASVRVDYFNAFNRTQLQSPDANSLDSTFGQITNLSSQISNRQGQATFRLEF
jgi:Carboxypeptidase regulatory-like domain